MKVYSDKMQTLLKYALIRFDTFLLNQDVEKYTSILRECFGGSIKEISFNEILEQFIDIDSVADTHNISITKVLQSNSIQLSELRIGQIQFDIIVNKFFIAFLTNKIDGNIEDSLSPICDAIKKMLETANLDLDLFLRLNYSVEKKSPDELWNICDRSAFPIMEGGNYSGQYTDSTEIDNTFIDLSRTISSSEIKEEPVESAEEKPEEITETYEPKAAKF